MIITFYSNYFNHHQKALCEALNAIDEVEFYFVETMPMEDFRKGMGWGVDELPTYVIQAHLSEDMKRAAMELARTSDVVIVGDAPEWYVEQRIKENQLTFRYTERPMKEGWIKMFIPRLGKKFYNIHYKNRDKQLYLLGASAYAAYDYRLLHSYPGKCLKFGYFPVGESLSEDEVLGYKNNEPSADNPLKILWTGRFLKLKRADLLLKALRKVRDRGINFSLQIVGNGEEEKSLKALVYENRLDDRIFFMNFVKPHEVREMMEKADIYVMTSNFLEGWGSVIYEALSAGCAVVASHACGCSPWLVKSGKTGLLFKSGSVDSLADKLEKFLTDDTLRRTCQEGAYRQMKSMWNPEVAAQRIVDFSKGIMAGKPVEYEDGPLSQAPVLKNNWYEDGR